jgi:hypothetical protein
MMEKWERIVQENRRKNNKGKDTQMEYQNKKKILKACFLK